MAGKESGAKEKEKKYVETPLMKQYYSIKAVHGDAVLLFRVGDFYETFGEDAVRASRILGITLTRRANGVASYDFPTMRWIPICPNSSAPANVWPYASSSKTPSRSRGSSNGA